MKAKRLQPLFKPVLAAIILTVLTAAPFTAADEPVSHAEKIVMDTVWNALNAKPELANHHRGFLRYLLHHPEFAAALEAIRPLERHPVSRDLMIEFNNALAGNPQLQSAFEKFYAALAQNDPIRDAVDALYRIELNLAPPTLQQAVVLLKADVDGAIQFLANPARPAMPGLQPFKAAFKQDPELRQRLLEQFNALHKMPAAHDAVFAWWRTVLAEQNDAGASYVRLLGELARRSDRFWAWHGAQVELAKHPNTRQWVVYWHSRVSNDTALRADYDAYINIIRRRPEYAKAAFDAWEASLGPAPPWPPDTEPPRTQPVRQDAARQISHGTTWPEVTKPQPKMPLMPDMPAKPETPPPPQPARPDMHRVQPE